MGQIDLVLCGRRSCEPSRASEGKRLLQLRGRGKFPRNLRVPGLLLEEVSTAGVSCVDSVPQAQRRFP